MATDATDPVLDNTSEEGEKLTPKQQKLFDDKIEARLKRHEKDLQAKVAALEGELVLKDQQLETANNVVKTAPKGSDEAINAVEEIAILRNEVEEVKKANKTLQTERDEIKKQADKAKIEVEVKASEMIQIRKRNAMSEAIAKYRFQNPKDVLELTEKFVKYDKDTDDFIVVKENGSPRFNSTADPMSLDELYVEWGTLNKHHVVAEAVAGFGSSESKGKLNSKGWTADDIFGPDADIKKAQELYEKDYNKYQALKQEYRDKQTRAASKK